MSTETASDSTVRVFVSYSHDSPEHDELVLVLADRLRADGIDAILDQYETAPPEGWTRWMRNGIATSNFVLVICTETYRRRAEGHEKPDTGKGVNYEGLTINQAIYDSDERNSTVIAVVLRAADREFVPDFLRPYQGESVETDAAYESLYRRLTDQPKVKKPVIGKLRSLPARERRTDFPAETSSPKSCSIRLPNPVQSENAPTPGSDSIKSPWRLLAWLLFPTVVIGICVAGAMFWRLPAKIEIDAIVSQAQFHTRGEDQQVVLEKADARSLALSGFKEVRFAPEEVWIFNPAKYDIQRDSYPEDGWHRATLPPGQDLVLYPSDQTSDTAITIQPDKTSKGSLELGSILVGRAVITVSVPEPQLLSLELRGGHQNGTVELPEKFLLLANSCENNGLAWPYLRRSVTLRIQLSPNKHFLAYSAEASGILFQTRFKKSDAPSLLGRSGLNIDDLSFLRAARLTPKLETTLDGPGSIKFVDHQGVDSVSLQKNHLLTLGGLRDFHILGATFSSDDKLKVQLNGTAGSLFSGLPGEVMDRRLTLFDVAWHNPKLTALFTIFVWLIPTLIAGRKFLKELKEPK
jgi:TIR domain